MAWSFGAGWLDGLGTGSLVGEGGGFTKVIAGGGYSLHVAGRLHLPSLLYFTPSYTTLTSKDSLSLFSLLPPFTLSYYDDYNNQDGA